MLDRREPERPEPGGRDLEQLALLVQVRREEDHDEHLADLGRLEPDRPDLHPQPRPVDRPADAGRDRQEQQQQTEQADRVGVRVEHPRVAHDDQRERVRDQPDDDPGRLFGRQAAREPEDHREAEADQHRRGGEQRGVGPRREHAGHEQRARVPRREDRHVEREGGRELTALAEPGDHVRADRQDQRQDRERDRGRERRAALRRRRATHGVDCSNRATSSRMLSTMASAPARSSAVMPSGSPR